VKAWWFVTLYSYAGPHSRGVCWESQERERARKKCMTHAWCTLEIWHLLLPCWQDYRFKLRLRSSTSLHLWDAYLLVYSQSLSYNGLLVILMSIFLVVCWGEVMVWIYLTNLHSIKYWQIIYKIKNKYLITLLFCKFFHLEITEGSEIVIVGACPLWET